MLGLHSPPTWRRGHASRSPQRPHGMTRLLHEVPRAPYFAAIRPFPLSRLTTYGAPRVCGPAASPRDPSCLTAACWLFARSLETVALCATVRGSLGDSAVDAKLRVTLGQVGRGMSRAFCVLQIDHIGRHLRHGRRGPDHGLH